MSAPLVLICLGCWVVVGLIVVESCRVWRAWWLRVDLFSVALWPLILFFTIANGPDQ